jgi:dTDP-4-dehydrorhamnose 3,5-epimerase-like enzyme
MIEGVEVKDLKQHKDNRGYLMEILRGSDAIKSDGEGAFGQYYLGSVYPGVIKGKHRHALQDDHLCIVSGNAAVHLEDGRDGPSKGEKQVVMVGEAHGWKLVKIPRGVWHSIENVGTDTCILVNYVTKEYNAKSVDEERGQFDIADKKMPWTPLITG